MEKKSLLKDVKLIDVQCAVAGVSVLFSALAAAFGYEELSISMAMIFTMVCVMGCMTKDLVELFDSLVNEDNE